MKGEFPKGKKDWILDPSSNLDPSNWVQHPDPICGPYGKMGLHGKLKGNEGDRFEGALTGTGGACTTFFLHVIDKREYDHITATIMQNANYTVPKDSDADGVDD